MADYLGQDRVHVAITVAKLAGVLEFSDKYVWQEFFQQRDGLTHVIHILDFMPFCLQVIEPERKSSQLNNKKNFAH